MSTRSNRAGAAKSTPQTTTTPVRLDNPMASPVPTTDLLSEDAEMAVLLASLPKEMKTQVKLLQTFITKQLKAEMDTLREELKRKDQLIEQMDKDVKDLQAKVDDLETHIDRVEQYERRDTIILSGPSLPPETPSENSASVVVSTIKDQLKLIIKEEDLSVAHRLGSAQQGRERPIIIKLVNRSLKQDIMGACIQLKPSLYVNESLTPKRLSIFKQVLAIRKEHRQKFQQLYTKEGNIIIKLKHSTVKHTIVDHKTFMALLNKYPYMKDTYNVLMAME